MSKSIVLAEGKFRVDQCWNLLYADDKAECFEYISTELIEDKINRAIKENNDYCDGLNTTQNYYKVTVDVKVEMTKKGKKRELRYLEL